MQSLGVNIALGMLGGGGGGGGGGGYRSRLPDVFTHFARAMNIY